MIGFAADCYVLLLALLHGRLAMAFGIACAAFAALIAIVSAPTH